MTGLVIVTLLLWAGWLGNRRQPRPEAPREREIEARIRIGPRE